MNLPLIRFVDRYIGVPVTRALAWGLTVRRPASGPGDPRRILILRGVGVGNLVLMLPTLKALRDRYPTARIFIDFEQFARTSTIVGVLLRIPRRIGFVMPGHGRESAFTDPLNYLIQIRCVERRRQRDVSPPTRPRDFATVHVNHRRRIKHDFPNRVVRWRCSNLTWPFSLAGVTFGRGDRRFRLCLLPFAERDLESPNGFA